MKTNAMMRMMICSLTGLGLAAGQVVEKREHSEAQAEAKAEAEASGDGSNVERKTVTVTSENGRTVRKTTTLRNGRETTKTEVLDGNGNVVGAGDAAEAEPGRDEDRAWIGLRVEESPAALRAQLGLAEDEGVVVNALAPDGPAAMAGLKVNDVLLKLDESPLAKPEDLRSALRTYKVGEQVTVTYLRRGAKATAEVTLARQPDDDPDAAGPPPDQRMNDPRQGGPDARKGAIEVEVSGNAGESLDSVLENPDVPEEFKKHVREMQEKMREFERSHGKP